MTPRNLKLLYILTLGLLGLYVTTGPAVAVSIGPSLPQIFNASANGIDHVEFFPGVGAANLLWNGPYFNGVSNNEIPPDGSLYLYTTADCDGPAGTFCSAHLPFEFDVSGTGSITLSLIGSSNDNLANGNLSFDGITEPWHVEGGILAMTAFTAYVNSGHYSGDFAITSLAGGSYLDLPIVFEAGAAPEPASALLLIGGFAVVEFLRRKSRR